MKLETADFFAGAGGFSIGAERSGAAKLMLAINHWPRAITTHTANFPTAAHFNARMEDVKPTDYHGRLRLILASPECTHFSVALGGRPKHDQRRAGAGHILPWLAEKRPEFFVVENVKEFCFPAETAVLTKRGMLPIGEIEVGDEVWTHNSRWKPVTCVVRRRADTVRVRGYGNTIVETTNNHQFYARPIAPEITQSGKAGRHKARLLEPEWVRADHLADKDVTTTYTTQNSGYAWASPHDLPRHWMRLPFALGVDVAAPAFFYMLGRWLGDGWIRRRKARHEQDVVRICANKPEAAELQERLAATGLVWHRSEHSDSVDVFDLAVGSSRILIPWLVNNFHEYADRKTVPAWLYRAAAEQRWALIEGHNDADGHTQDDNETSFVSVSRCLAVGLRLVLHSLGVPASISVRPACELPRIGRPEELMACLPAYQVSWRRKRLWEKCQRAERHLWGRVRAVEPARTNVEVVDITVADDHSFIADGQVVHNCTWGPLDKHGKSVKEAEGTFFQAWLKDVKELGYKVEFRLLNAADYGAATSRTRLIVIGRRASRRKAIPWPEATHAQNGAGGLLPWVPAHSIIDWSRPVRSIFRRDVKLAPKTLRRIAVGLRKFCQPGARLFLMNMKGASDCVDPDAPMPTQTAHARHMGLVAPFGVSLQQHNRGSSLEQPMGTVLASGHHHGVVAPFVTANFGERPGQDPRTHQLMEPTPTITPRGAGNLIMPFMLASGSGPAPRSVDDAAHTFMTTAKPQLVMPFMMSTASGGAARGADDAAPTFTTKGGCQLVVPYAIEVAHGDRRASCANSRVLDLGHPFRTMTTTANQGLVAASTMNYYGTGHCDPVEDPLATVTSKARHALVTYVPGGDRLPNYGDIDFANVGPLTKKMREKDRDLYYIESSILSAMAELGIFDIGFRMFENEELALAMGFLPDYVFTGTKTEITKQIGNAVSPILSEAIVRALVA